MTSRKTSCEQEPDGAKIRAAMRREVSNCRDPHTNEVNFTQLAENIANQLNLYENARDYTIPEYVYEIAVEFSES